MTTKTKVSIADASPAQLRWYASAVLGLDDIKKGTSAANIIGKIHAVSPNLAEIEVPEDLVEDAPAAPVTPKGVKLADSDAKIPAGRPGQHFRFDPKVTLEVMRTNDKRRAKRVFVTCNGDTIEIQRGVPVQIPYRFYLVMLDAVEKVSIELDEINPVTGLPLREWVEQQSYDFNVKAMPSQEEIDAWFARTKDATL
ncbi:MAG: hypothetical protein A2792_03430 [Sphingomonadales bacterium RIFCSPHIGHO2_01_FULL_65_20]|nr:MAG: hypothetical protein A2792_03430 [Sphingomonadales bacterium RIFCSPHIGHO2_01_FULL_65_20]